MPKVGDRVSVRARRRDGTSVVVRAIVRETHAHKFVCVCVSRHGQSDHVSVPTALRLDERGVTWATGWNSPAARALATTVALS